MFFSFGPELGYQIFTASGIVGDSGKPQALYAEAHKSGGTGGTVTFFNGTSSLGTAVYDVPGTANVTVFNSPSIGQVFLGGLYVSFDSNVTKATIWFRQI